MTKPRIWLSAGVWHCCTIGPLAAGNQQQSGLVASGKGESPEAAYASWARKEFFRVIRRSWGISSRRSLAND